MAFKRRDRRRSRSRNAKKQKVMPVYLLDRMQRSVQPTYALRYPVPVKAKRTLRYVENAITLNPGVAGIAADYVISANGLFDPNVTGVGHQPIGFDQMMQMYNHYTVIGAKLTAIFSSIDTVYEQIVGIAQVADATAITNGQEAVENGLVTFKMLQQAGTAKQIVQMTSPLSIGKFMGRRSILSEDDFRGTSLSNPTEQAYFHLISYHGGAVDISGCRLDIVVDYITVFTEPKYLSQS